MPLVRVIYQWRFSEPGASQSLALTRGGSKAGTVTAKSKRKTRFSFPVRFQAHYYWAVHYHIMPPLGGLERAERLWSQALLAYDDWSPFRGDGAATAAGYARSMHHVHHSLGRDPCIPDPAWARAEHVSHVVHFDPIPPLTPIELVRDPWRSVSCCRRCQQQKYPNRS